MLPVTTETQLVCVVYCRIVNTNKGLESICLGTADFKTQETDVFQKTDVFLLLHFSVFAFIHPLGEAVISHAWKGEKKKEHIIFGWLLLAAYMFLILQ